MMKLKNSKKGESVKLPYMGLKTEVCAMDTEMFIAASPNNPGTNGGGWSRAKANESVMWEEDEENSVFD